MTEFWSDAVVRDPVFIREMEQAAADFAAGRFSAFVHRVEQPDPGDTLPDEPNDPVPPDPEGEPK